jgi:hypothetical protein
MWPYFHPSLNKDLFISHLIQQELFKTYQFFFFFFGLPHLATYIFLVFSTNEPELGARINPGMALNVDHFHLVFWMRFEPTTFRS